MNENKQIPVMIVEDDRDTAETLSMMLKLQGCLAYTLHTREEAVRSFKAVMPQVLLLDYKMNSTLSIEEFIQQCRQFCPSCKIVLMTGVTNAAEVAQKLGADAYFEKPVEMEGLAQYLSTL